MYVYLHVWNLQYVGFTIGRYCIVKIMRTWWGNDGKGIICSISGTRYLVFTVRNLLDRNFTLMWTLLSHTSTFCSRLPSLNVISDFLLYYPIPFSVFLQIFKRITSPKLYNIILTRPLITFPSVPSDPKIPSLMSLPFTPDVFTYPFASHPSRPLSPNPQIFI